MTPHITSRPLHCHYSLVVLNGDLSENEMDDSEEEEEEEVEEETKPGRHHTSEVPTYLMPYLM